MISGSIKNINDFNISVHFLMDTMEKKLHYMTSMTFEMVNIGISSTVISVLISLAHMNIFNI